MDAARIAELLQPFLGEPQLPLMTLEQTSTYIDLLLRWNARINLTAIRDPASIVTRHFGESFFLARHLFPSASSQPAALASRGNESHLATNPARINSASAVIDIGSGAGFPGLPIKIWAPDVTLTLVEANHKKAAFLREVVRGLTLMNVDVITERVETLTARRDLLAHIVTLRAVEHFENLLPVAARLVAPHGRLALLIGSAQVPTASKLLPTFDWLPPISIPISRSRVLAIGNRVTN